jgi:hypothetical protein
VVDRPVAEHFEVLRLSLGRCVGVLLGEGVGHADAFDRLLGDTIDHYRCLDAGDFKDGWDNVDHVVELRAEAASILNAIGPRDRHPLPRATEV